MKCLDKHLGSEQAGGALNSRSSSYLWCDLLRCLLKDLDSVSIKAGLLKQPVNSPGYSQVLCKLTHTDLPLCPNLDHCCAPQLPTQLC